MAKISVGVVVQRRPAHSPWLNEFWRVISVFSGTASAEPWTVLDSGPEATTFYAGQASIELHRTETSNYLANLSVDPPLLWVVLRRTDEGPGMKLQAVTADPAEGEALSGSGNDLIETVPMPAAVVPLVRAFIAEHHVERPMYRRQREPHTPT